MLGGKNAALLSADFTPTCYTASSPSCPPACRGGVHAGGLLCRCIPNEAARAGDAREARQGCGEFHSRGAWEPGTSLFSAEASQLPRSTLL